MNPIIGWVLAVLIVVVSWRAYQWEGVALAFTLIVFWLVLQFNRSIRVMKNAAGSPVGHVGSAVALNAKLRVGMQMLQVVGFTKSLGRRPATAGVAAAAGADDVFAWADADGSEVVITFRNGRCASWVLHRPEQGAE